MRISFSFGIEGALSIILSSASGETERGDNPMHTGCCSFFIGSFVSKTSGSVNSRQGGVFSIVVEDRFQDSCIRALVSSSAGQDEVVRYIGEQEQATIR